MSNYNIVAMELAADLCPDGRLPSTSATKNGYLRL
eukprot:SAG31_NODE_29702_length_391_cov_0.750000_1_plen_34_part_10